MPPLVLPLPLSTEITMQALMDEASNYLNAGRYQSSYELYIEALLSAVKEFKQVEFNDQCIDADLSPVFTLADTCLQHAKEISSKCFISNQCKSPPPIPPKPSRLSALKPPPPLPIRPLERAVYSTEMKRATSKPEFVKRTNVNTQQIYSYSDDDTYTDDDDYEDSDDDDDEEKESTKIEVEQSMISKNSSPCLKIATNKPVLARRSSTSNISNSAPSSPIVSAPNPLNAVKSFLSLPGHSDSGIKRGLAFIDSCYGSEASEVFFLANGIIDPQVLVTVQTNSSDSLSPNHHAYLPMIPQAPLVTVYQSIQKKLEENPQDKSKLQSTLNQVRNLHMSATTVPTILQFNPILIAYQLTLIDSTIFRNISTDAILSHSPKTPQPSIVASTDFFNYLTRLIEHAILLQQDASGRAQHINHWIKVAGKCHELKNYQTLKAVISALGTPPIQRLKRSWQFIPKKSMNLLDDLSELMSEASNYGKYRDRLGITFQQDEVKNRDEVRQRNERKNSFSQPTVPFLGIFIHDMTYLVAAQSKKKTQVHNSDWKISSNEQQKNINMLQQDARVSELLKLFKNLQRSPPYSPNLSANCVKDLNKNRKRKLSHALTRTTAIKKTPANDDDGDLSIEMQQCLVTQYLLTRSWVSEKTVDELSLVREPTKTSRSYSLTDSLAAPLQQQSSSVPPPPTSSTSLTTSTQVLRSSSGSMTSGSTSSNNSRPMSLEDEGQPDDMDKKSNSFWLFGRKSVDNNLQYGTLHRSPRHFSFEELNGKKPAINDCRMQREGSQSSLTIFRKDFWKNAQQKHERKGNNPSPSSSTVTEYRQITNKNLKNVLSSPHPLDSSSEFQWEYHQ